MKKMGSVGFVKLFVIVFIYSNTFIFAYGNGIDIVAESKTSDTEINYSGPEDPTSGAYLPKSEIGELKVNFLLFTLKDPDNGQSITDTTLLGDTNWNPHEESIFCIHGYIIPVLAETTATEAGVRALSIRNANSSESIRKAFMESNRTENLIIVDWHEASRKVIYFVAAKNTKVVGEKLGNMIISLKERGFLTYEQVHLVGFSLGAQISGVAGYHINSKVNQKISRITGLDPAGPAFGAETDINLRLDPTDAEYVDVIHCNAGELLPMRNFGTTLQCGHIDFYPNGGAKQPGCLKKDLVIAQCSHLKCHQLYASSVRGVNYNGCECSNLAQFENGQCEVCNGPPMGYLCPKGSSGTYYLKAEADPRDNYDSLVR